MYKLVIIYLFSIALAQANDPTKPSHYSATKIVPSARPSVDNLYLSGVISSANGKIAIINSRPMGIGASINGYRVQAISSNSVTLNKGGKLQIIKIESAKVISKTPETVDD